MARYRGRGKVTWSNPESHVKVLRPHPYVPEVKIPDHLVEVYMVSLVPGALFFTTNPLFVDKRYADSYARHEFFYLHYDPYAAWGQPVIPIGTMAVYAGQHRVEEVSRTGTDTVRLSRHTFVVGGTRYLTANLTDYTPAGS